MPAKKTTVALLPQKWLDVVIPILELQDSKKILWTKRAELEMSSAGLNFKHEAYELCLQVLRTPGMLGEQIHDMIDETDGTVADTWAFLCPHPLKLPEPLYVKIAVHEKQVHLTMISMHTDNSGKLLKAIRDYMKKNK